MEKDQIVIKLTKKGAGKSPDYYLKLFEDGSIIYEGYENVKIIGKVEKSVIKSKFLELLAEFRNLNFFSLRDDYSIIDDTKLKVEPLEIFYKPLKYFK